MRVYKYLRKKGGWTPLDNDVLTISRGELTDGAKILYWFLGGYSQNGKNMSRNYILKCLGIAQSTYEKYIKQLKRLDLVHVKRTGAKDYECYVGTTLIPASKVEEYWHVLKEEDAPDPLTLEDLVRMRDEQY